MKAAVNALITMKSRLKISWSKTAVEPIPIIGKISTIFREKNQAKQVSAGLECGISFKDFNDFQKKDIIEAYSSTTTERVI